MIFQCPCCKSKLLLSVLEEMPEMSQKFTVTLNGEEVITDWHKIQMADPTPTKIGNEYGIVETELDCASTPKEGR